jgi:Fungal Zn(2)-Cys(6) binuclear cluster domain
VLYCRQKLLQQYHSRKKSCARCRHAKTRCDQSTPQCSRCKLKGVDCVYDDTLQRASSSQLPEPKQPQPIKDTEFCEASLTMGQSSPNCVEEVSAIEGQNVNRDIPADMEIAPLDSWHDLLLHSVSEGEFQENSQTVTLTSLHDQPLDAYLDPEIDLSWSLLEQDALFVPQNRPISPHQVAESYFPRETREIGILLNVQSRYRLIKTSLRT